MSKEINQDELLKVWQEAAAFADDPTVPKKLLADNVTTMGGERERRKAKELGDRIRSVANEIDEITETPEQAAARLKRTGNVVAFPDSKAPKPVEGHGEDK